MMSSRTFPGFYSSLGPISEFVAKEAQNAGLNEESVYSVQLAVDEACTNIIEHAYQGEGKGDITCICIPVPDGFQIELRDRGRAFYPDSIPEPKVGAPLEDLGNRGAGLFLMRKLMDDVHYEFSEDDETILRMTKKVR